MGDDLLEKKVAEEVNSFILEQFSHNEYNTDHIYSMLKLSKILRSCEEMFHVKNKWALD